MATATATTGKPAEDVAQATATGAAATRQPAEDVDQTAAAGPAAEGTLQLLGFHRLVRAAADPAIHLAAHACLAQLFDQRVQIGWKVAGRQRAALHAADDLF